MSTSETRNENDRMDAHEPESDRAPSSGRDPLGPVLESFLVRFRNGERPSVTEYVGRYPALADEIRELFPALVEIERLGSVGGAAIPAGTGMAGAGVSGIGQGVRIATDAFDPTAGLAATAADRPSAWPRRLGDYRILGWIGEGGMGVVYEAVRESLKSRVALKVMHPRFRASSGYLRRFHNEARSAAQLHHTNIVSVFDYGEHDGVCYYAMQYIAGHSLDEILVEVRRLRSNPGQQKAVLVEVGLGPSAKGLSASPEPVVGGAQTEATTDLLMRTVTDRLLTGQFANAADVALDIEGPPSLATEPIEPATGARTEATNDFGFRLGRTRSPASPPRGDEDPNHPDSTSCLSSSSLTGQGDDRYHREVARLGAQVADALAYAHNRRVLHRDIKPSNLLLDAVGNAWVTDFGLAKFEEGEDLSRSQDVVGTMRYMAPERFRGVSDRRCDIYALGATLYEMLTLRPVFEISDRLRLIAQIVHEPPAPPRQLDRRIPRDLETIVLRALAKEPKDRFGTADELAAELRRFLEHRPIRSRPISAHERIWRWCKRNRAVAALTSLAAALTVLIAIGATVAAWIYYGQSNELRSEQLHTKASLSRAEHAEREGRLALGKSLVSEGAALQRTGMIGQRFDSLDRLGKAAQVLGADPDGRKRLPEIRNHAIAALGLTDLRMRRQHECGVVLDISVDPALERYAVVERSGAVVVRRLDDDRELIRLPGPDRRELRHANLIFSPNGELLAANYLGGKDANLLCIWHLGQQELLGALHNPRGVPLPRPGTPLHLFRYTGGGVVFHPDGRRLVFRATEGGISVWDRVERRVVRRLALDFPPGYFALDPAGLRLAVNNHTMAGPPRLVILELETGRVLADWRAQVGRGALAWSADGQLLAIGNLGDDAPVYVWNVHRGALASVLQGHSQEIIAAQFAHMGYLLATTDDDGTTRLWDAASGEHLAMAPGNVLGLSPDDRRLAVKNRGAIAVWDVAAGAEWRVLHPAMLGNRNEKRDASTVHCADVSPDGQLVATCDRDGVRLWETETGRELAHLKGGFCTTVLFHPDGQSLISCGAWGLYRWPIGQDPDRGPDAIRVGLPELLRETRHTDFSDDLAVWLPDHRTLALWGYTEAQVWLVDSSHPNPALSRARALDSGVKNRGTTSITVSPDRRWLAVAGGHAAGVRVWDLRRQRLERILEPKQSNNDPSVSIRFSPDGQWLISTSSSVLSGFQFWRVGSWELGQGIDQQRNWSPLPAPHTADGRLMAVGSAPDQVLLADPDTGRELARLTTLRPVEPTPLVFSPDGTKLIAATRQKTVLIWDLRQIRAQLIAMGLDWDAPPYPTVPAAGDGPGLVPPPRRVRVVGEVIEPQARRAAEWSEMNRRLAANPDDADALVHRGWLFHQEKKWPEAIADLERRLRLRPDDSDACWMLAEAYQKTDNPAGEQAIFGSLLPDDPTALNKRAWIYATGPIDQRDPELAVALARLAVAMAPGRQSSLNTLAVALSRTGQYAQAISVLEQSLAAGKGGSDAFDLFMLAMAHHRLGHAAHARTCFGRAVWWWSDQKNLSVQQVSALTSLRAEAEEVLASARAQLPADVFAPE
jgi:eukaryotic-like serine/threonine-protein kinase